MDQRQLPGQLDPAHGHLGLGDPDAEQSSLADLLRRSRLYHNSNDHPALLDCMSRQCNCAPFNAISLPVKKPGLTHAASTWGGKMRVNRMIEEGARPIPHPGVSAP